MEITGLTRDKNMDEVVMFNEILHEDMILFLYCSGNVRICLS